MNKLQSDNLLNALCLHDNDNILITIKNLNSGMVLNEYGITMDAPALSGQKIARFDIEKDDPIIKYGTVIGFADSNIKKGQVLTCLLYTSPSPRDATLSRMPSSA